MVLFDSENHSKEGKGHLVTPNKLQPMAKLRIVTRTRPHVLCLKGSAGR